MTPSDTELARRLLLGHRAAPLDEEETRAVCRIATALRARDEEIARLRDGMQALLARHSPPHLDHLEECCCQDCKCIRALLSGREKERKG